MITMATSNVFESGTSFCSRGGSWVGLDNPGHSNEGYVGGDFKRPFLGLILSRLGDFETRIWRRLSR